MSTTPAPAPQPIGYKAEITFADGQVLPTKRHPAKYTLADVIREMQTVPGYVSHVVKPVYSTRAAL